ncbi:TPA: class I SAM-dependent methyltransferase [Pseudomonas aeruginosa]|nr:class I SAM-dependent methyltransferase [Pseudomonas aeruginosa]
MRDYAWMYEYCLNRFGSREALEARLPQPKSAAELRTVGDDRYLSLISLRIFRAGLKHSLVDAKWPAFEEVFFGFDPQKVVLMSAEHLERLIAPEQGQFIALLLTLIGARRALEVGTFTGYSALCMATALGEQGRLTCCDLPGDYHLTARRYWREAAVEERIELRLGPALETLRALLDEGLAGQFDLAFIDADKANYPEYLEAALALVRQGGLVLFDNVLWSGRVLEAQPKSADTRGIQQLNLALKNDARVDYSLLPIGDGLSVCRKR